MRMVFEVSGHQLLFLAQANEIANAVVWNMYFIDPRALCPLKDKKLAYSRNTSIMESVN